MNEIKSEATLHEISESECLEILERHSFGRIALVVDGQPQIFPVNYDMSDRLVVLRTGHGVILAHAPESKVAFEVDEYDARAGAGWSVMVQGVARDATDSLDDISWTARAAAPSPAAPGVKRYWIAIEPVQITGRRFRAEI
jgi:hypothetical protein